ncbi:MAG: hypothetical protein WCP74_04655 [Sphingobacteriia bacterium]|jgi:hypothetical protein
MASHQKLYCLFLFGLIHFIANAQSWQSKWVSINKKGAITYTPDEKGNTIPDFSRVGYFHGDRSIPNNIPIFIQLKPSDNDLENIQSAIESLSKNQPNEDGLRGVIVLTKGTYSIPNTIYIKTSGIVIRGEGPETKLIATGKMQYSLFKFTGSGSVSEKKNSREKITDEYVPVGSFSFNVSNANNFSIGEKIMVYRPGTAAWIKDLQMDQIEVREDTKQWTPQEYGFNFERTITKIEGNMIFIDNPIVLALEAKYGGGSIYSYSFNSRINQVGIENLYCESVFEKDTSENHAWVAVEMDKVENGWVRNITSRYFGNSCVHLGTWAKNISVLNSNCYDAKSIITGSRRYSFSNAGQQNLFMNCVATEGRHDFVTEARVCGPNVFYNCSATKTHADIGPHHRWTSGTLYDNITTDGEIAIQDRGNWGSGHGWSGVNQVLWNCTVQKAVVQSPWVNGKNYAIGLQGEKYEGRLKNKPDGEWEGQNKKGLTPASLYLSQLKARK